FLPKPLEKIFCLSCTRTPSPSSSATSTRSPPLSSYRNRTVLTAPPCRRALSIRLYTTLTNRGSAKTSSPPHSLTTFTSPVPSPDAARETMSATHCQQGLCTPSSW